MRVWALTSICLKKKTMPLWSLSQKKFPLTLERNYKKECKRCWTTKLTIMSNSLKTCFTISIKIIWRFFKRAWRWLMITDNGVSFNRLRTINQVWLMVYDNFKTRSRPITIHGYLLLNYSSYKYSTSKRTNAFLKSYSSFSSSIGHAHD